MAKIVSYQGTHPNKIDGCAIYELDGQLVIRGISGFNSTALKKKQSMLYVGKIPMSLDYLVALVRLYERYWLLV